MSPAATAPPPVDEILPLRRMIPLGIQEVFVMAASPISTFILSGLRTILQFGGPWKFGAQLPFVMLPGSAPIVLFLGIAKQYDIRTAVGAVVLAQLSVLLVPEMLPSWDLERELVRLANRGQILAVVVGGRPRLWRGWPVDWDARQLLEEARRRARKVGADAPVHIVHPTAGEHRRASRAGRRTKAPA
jgi:hypothetical protein